MKRFLLLPVLAAFLLASPNALAATKTVSITNAGFVPNAITIDAGDSITWTNSDTKNHQPISKNAPFTSPILKPGETYTFQFKSDGRFNITDELVKHQRMTVTVRKAATPVGAPTLTVEQAEGRSTAAPSMLSGKVPVAKAGEKVTLRAEVLTPHRHEADELGRRGRLDRRPARSRSPPSRRPDDLDRRLAGDPGRRDEPRTRHGHGGAANRRRHRQEGRPLRHLLH